MIHSSEPDKVDHVLPRYISSGESKKKHLTDPLGPKKKRDVREVWSGQVLFVLETLENRDTAFLVRGDIIAQ